MLMNNPSGLNLRQLRHQSKELLKSFKSGESEAFFRISEFHPKYSGFTQEELQKSDCKLADTQLVIARELGYKSWAKLKAAIDAPTKRPPAQPTDPEEAQAKTELEKLGARCRVNSKGHVYEVGCKGPEFTDSIIKRLTVFTYLTRLSLNNAKLTKTGFEHLKKLVHLRELYLVKMPTGDEELRFLSGCSNIKKLGLGRTKITDKGLEFISGLTHLEELHLNNTGITDNGLHYLSGLVNLQILNLSKTKISGEGMVNLRTLPRLKKLGIWDVPISAAGIRNLLEMSTLEKVYINRTVFTKDGIEELDNFRRKRFWRYITKPM